MDNKKYNGYTNYITWRVNLEILDGIDWDGYEEVTGDILKEIVEDVVFDNSVEKDCLAASYARISLEDVNYQEIAEHINDERSCTAE